MKIKEQTRKLAVGCSKHSFEVVDKTDEVSSKHCFEVADRTDEVSNHTYGKVNLKWFEESTTCLLKKESIMKVFQHVNIVKGCCS
ncbi:chlorohydrolase [Streptococcus pneumoniae]|nr:chlorohydrolase [Streptococcus pneumoniae]